MGPTAVGAIGRSAEPRIPEPAPRDEARSPSRAQQYQERMNSMKAAQRSR